MSGVTSILLGRPGDTGRFALEEAAPEIAAQVLAFLDRQEAAARAALR